MLFDNNVNNFLSKNSRHIYSNTAISGYISGVAASLFVAPMEAVKMNQQHNLHAFHKYDEQ